MIEDIDLHMGRRLRRRRLLLGLTQQQLGAAAGCQLQQVQKFECAANKMSADKVWRFARALDVPVTYFYDGLSGRAAGAACPSDDADILSSKETTDLVAAYYGLKARPRRHLLDLAKSLNEGAAA